MNQVFLFSVENWNNPLSASLSCLILSYRVDRYHSVFQFLTYFGYLLERSYYTWNGSKWNQFSSSYIEQMIKPGHIIWLGLHTWGSPNDGDNIVFTQSVNGVGRFPKTIIKLLPPHQLASQGKSHVIKPEIESRHKNFTFIITTQFR